MPESVTDILQQMASGGEAAQAKLLPLVYAELGRLARHSLGRLPPTQTLQPTALVHEAYLKLFDASKLGWESRGHFFTAAARAMRNILVDQARRKAALKRGGDWRKVDAEPYELPIESPAEDILALHEAIERLERDDPRKAQMVMLRFFVGLTGEEIAELLGVTTRTVERDWRYCVARLHRDMRPGEK